MNTNIQPGIVRKLLSLSWPLMVSETMGMLVPTLDMVWIGRLGVDALAGVGIAGTVATVVMSSVAGIMTGLRATVSRLTGNNDLLAAAHMVKQALFVAVVYTSLIAIAGIWFSHFLLTILGLSAKAIADGTVFLRLMLGATPIFVFRLILESAMQAAGDTLTPMKITVFHRLLHAALSPLLVFGWLMIPGLGVSGIVWAPIIAQSIGLAVALYVLAAGKTRLRLSFRQLRIVPGDVWRLVKISLPPAFAFTQNDLGGMLISWIMIPYGTVAVAAHVLSRRVQMMLFMPVSGISMAAGIMTGQYLGNKKPEMAVRNGWMATGITTLIGVIAALVILFLAEPVVRLFNTEPGLVSTGAVFLRIDCLTYLVIGAVIVFMNCVNGAGDTVPPMIILFVSLWVIGIPAIYFLPRFLDISMYGVRWLLQSTSVTMALGMTIYFQLGRWKTRAI